ncbi:nucleotidyltransferase domain-containing protein [Rhodopila sp.]
MVLFGSRARGDAHSESDYDIAISSRTSRIAGPRWTALCLW